MDQNPYRRKPSPISTTTGGSNLVTSSELLPMKFLSFGTMKLTRTFTTCLILFSVLLAFSMILHHHPSDPNRIMGFAEARVLDGRDYSNVTVTNGMCSSKSKFRSLLHLRIYTSVSKDPKFESFYKSRFFVSLISSLDIHLI